MTSARDPRGFVLPLLVVLLGSACRSAEEHQQEADDAVYEIVSERRAALGVDGAFSVAARAEGLRATQEGALPALLALDLAACQELAAENSRAYQDQRESLYLAALDLTLEHYRFGTQVSAGGSAVVSGTGGEAEGLDVGAGVAFTRVLGNGARVVLDLGSSLFESLANGDPGAFFTDVGLTFSLPLLAGGSEEELFLALTRAERRVVDQVRSYERFRRTFAVDVFDRYWRILEQIEVIRNEETNYDSLVLDRERNEALAEAGRQTDIQVGQARQDELRARSRLISARQNLETQLDDFKLFLGLPMEVQLSLDPGAFAAMAGQRIEALEYDEAVAIEAALTHRFDLATDRDRLLDAERDLRIAERELGAVLDLSAGVGAGSEANAPLSYSDDPGWNVGLDLDLPVGRVAERNAYRRAQLSVDGALRDLEASTDGVRADVRARLRSLGRIAEDYQIQLISVERAALNAESAQIKLEAGLAQTRDLLDAREDLLQAQNALVSALVDYNLERLRLYLDMELLAVDDQGVRRMPYEGLVREPEAVEAVAQAGADDPTPERNQ